MRKRQHCEFWATEKNRRLATIKHLLTLTRDNQIRSLRQGNNVFDKRGKSGRTRLQQRPKVGGRLFWNDECTGRAARTSMFDHIHSHGYRWTKPIILPPPILGKGINGATARRHELRIKSRYLSMVVGCESVNGMWTPNTVQLGENL